MEKEIQNKSGWFAKGGVLAGVFAFIGASCCILPIILINLGLSSAIVSHLGFLARMRPWFLGLTIILIIAGFIYAFSRREASASSHIDLFDFGDPIGNRRLYSTLF